MMRNSVMILMTCLCVIGCEKKAPEPTASEPVLSQPAAPPADQAKAPPAPAETKPAPAAEPDKTPAAPADAKPAAPVHVSAHGGVVIDLGETMVGDMTVRASRDEGEITPGGDVPADVWINGGLGDAAAVRLWIGTEDAQGSLKAKAATEAGHWHTHVEIPSPIPAESALWVEIEGKDGAKQTVSFDLKP